MIFIPPVLLYTIVVVGVGEQFCRQGLTHFELYSSALCALVEVMNVLN